VSLKAMLPMLTYLRAEGIALSASTVVSRGPVDLAIGRYRDYLVHERGLAQLTIHNYINAVRPFLRSALSRDGAKINWESLNAAKVTAFVVARTPSQSRNVASTTVTALRSFLGYLYANGLIKQQLTAAVPAVAGWRLAALPKTLQPREVQALLEECDRRVLARSLFEGKAIRLSRYHVRKMSARQWSLICAGAAPRRQRIVVYSSASEHLTAHLEESG
jgi:integrase/recombinase XerD